MRNRYRNRILFNSGVSDKLEPLDESTETYIRLEEIKTRISDSFNKLMRDLMYAKSDFRYGNFGSNEEETLKQNLENKKVLYEFATEKMNKLKEVIEENLGTKKAEEKSDEEEKVEQ